MFVKINRALDASRARREENEKGFTLIELLVVVLIIGILSAIAIPIFLNQQRGARDSAVQSDITNAKIAVVSYIVANPTLGFPLLTNLTEFVPNADSNLSLTGDNNGFCIEGFSGDNNPGATHYGASDTSGTVPGTCSAGVLSAGTQP